MVNYKLFIVLEMKSNLFCMLSLTMGTVEVVRLYTPLLPYTPQCLCHTRTYSDKGRPTQGRCHLQSLGNGARLEWNMQ